MTVAVSGHTHIRVSKSTNNRLLSAREITGKSVSEMVEEAIAQYLEVDVLAQQLERESRRKQILLGKLRTP